MHKVPSDQLERYSSAFTLSDMEIFVFPELLYSLVLANILSPRVWAWRDDPWFAKMEKLTPYRRVLRLKQFIIDHYEFNLDLDTWGLTRQETELRRFEPFMSRETISASNALFGYHGDRYYFDLDIRRHFGLDAYDGDVIPYWKTETVEAMDAFRFKAGYRAGAGECVSLSTLYAAALFVVCGVPLEDIYLMATPLHSQNFVDVQDGVLTNNRRLVTKNMWFNGTALTDKAQRALRNERMTIVSHLGGYVHVVYPEATIDPGHYARFQSRLRSFLSTDLDHETFVAYLRQKPDLHTCFQWVCSCSGRTRYIEAEKVFRYERGSAYRADDDTFCKLMAEIDEDEFYVHSIDGRIPINPFEAFFRKNKLDLSREEDAQLLAREFTCYNARALEIARDIGRFIRLEPRWPDADEPKRFRPAEPIALEPGMTREAVIERLDALRERHPTADLAFYAYRDMARCDWAPFLKAAFERNPVGAKQTEGSDERAILARLEAMPFESIYDGPRMAQPDEVWNFGRGDGLEKAVALAVLLKQRAPSRSVRLQAEGGRVSVEAEGLSVTWPTVKALELEWDACASS